MAMDKDDYVSRMGVTQESLNRQARLTTSILEKVQSEALSFLVNDPTWNVYSEKLSAARKTYSDLVADLERRMVDVQRPLTTDEHQKLLPQLAFARGYITAVETALEIVLQSQSKRED